MLHMAGLPRLLPAALWITVCFCNADRPPCPERIQKRVGETVEIPSCSASKITDAYWKYKDNKILSNGHVVVGSPLKNRLRMGNTTFNLILSDLTLQDSGSYGFFSSNGSTQYKTLFIHLGVYEAITEVQVRRLNSTWDTAANKCAIWFECAAAHSHNGINYSLSIGNETYSGATHRYVSHKAMDTVTCTASNPVSQESASEQVECSSSAPDEGLNHIPGLWVYLGMGLGGLVLVLLLCLVLALVCCTKQRKAATVESYYDTVQTIAPKDTAAEDQLPLGPLYETFNHTQPRPPVETIYYTVQHCRNVSSS